MNRFWKQSYGDVMAALIKEHGLGKGEDFFTSVCHGDSDEADFVLECEIKDMPTPELIDLLEQAGVLRAPPSIPDEPAKSTEPTGFTWTENMHGVFNNLSIELQRKSYPDMDRLLDLWRALHEAATYE